MGIPLKTILFCFICALAASCTVGPEYRRPETAVDRIDAFRHAPDDLRQVSATESFSRWWRSMDDPWLDRSVDLLLEDNLQLKEAAARVHQAWARLGIVRGGRLPAVALSGSALRSFQGTGAVFPQSGAGVPATAGTPTAAGGGERLYFTRLEMGLSTSWQLDLFGRLERAATAAGMEYLAALAEAEALVHSLIAELARRRVSVATLRQRIELVEETVENRELTLTVVERRYRRGIADTSAADVYLARENLAAAAARIPSLRSELRQQLHTIDVLLGLVPGTTVAAETGMAPLPPPNGVSVGLPARLVDRRPDLRANELRLAASVEQIGVTVADLYPDLTLTGSIGLADNELAGFFDSANLFGSIVGDLMLRLFEGGRLRANIDLREAEAEELVAAYAQGVLPALEEVETALSNGNFFSMQLELLADQLENVRKAARQLREQYGRGLVPLLDVLVTERRRYEAEQEYLLTAQAAWNNRIALYLALGGDWLDRRPDPEPMRLPQ